MNAPPKPVSAVLAVALLASVTFNVFLTKKLLFLESQRAKDISLTDKWIEKQFILLPEAGLRFMKAHKAVDMCTLSRGNARAHGTDDSNPVRFSLGAGTALLHGARFLDIDASQLAPLPIVNGGAEPDDPIDRPNGNPEPLPVEHRILRRLMWQLFKQSDGWSSLVTCDDGAGNPNGTAVGFMTHPAGIIVLVVTKDPKQPSLYSLTYVREESYRLGLSDAFALWIPSRWVEEKIQAEREKPIHSRSAQYDDR